MTRMVQCVRLGRELPGLEEPPFHGELGERIYNTISQQVWQMWLDQQVNIINHYSLVLADPQARQFLMKQMDEFLFGDNPMFVDDSGGTPQGG